MGALSLAIYATTHIVVLHVFQNGSPKYKIEFMCISTSTRVTSRIWCGKATRVYWAHTNFLEEAAAFSLVFSRIMGLSIQAKCGAQTRTGMCRNKAQGPTAPLAIP